MRFQVFRRVGKRGLIRVEATNAKHVKSRVLGCSLRSVGADPDMVRLRLATGVDADQIFPTDAEAEHAALEVEHAARVEAEVEIARLRAELKRLRKP